MYPSGCFAGGYAQTESAGIAGRFRILAPGQPRMRNPGGRPAHPATELVEELLANGLSERVIVDVVRAKTGHVISRRTIGRIRRGESQAGQYISQLADGETVLVVAERCPGCRQLINIKPCRWCLRVERLTRVSQLAREQRRPDDAI